MAARIEVITPEKAEKLLSQNIKNRSLSKVIVRRYAADMASGDFVGADSIKIGRDGVLQDGQHRLAAVIASGVAQKMLVVDDLPENAFDKWDVGKKRSGKDVATIVGFPQSSIVASVAQMYHLYRKLGSPERAGHLPLTNMLKNKDMAQFLGEVGSGGIGDAILNAARISENTRLCDVVTKSGGAFCVLNWAEATDEPTAEEFAEMIGVGYGLEKMHPALLVRNQILKERARAKSLPPQTWMVALAFKAWNEWLCPSGNKRLFFRWNIGDEFPKLKSVLDII